MSASTAIEIVREGHRRPYETVATPDSVPLYDLVPVKGPSGEPLDTSRGARVMNSLDGSWAGLSEGTGLQIAGSNQSYAGTNSLVELQEVHLSPAADLLAMFPKTIHAILYGSRVPFAPTSPPRPKGCWWRR